MRAYDCAGIEWFAWITDLVWVRIILAQRPRERRALAHPRLPGSIGFQKLIKEGPVLVVIRQPFGAAVDFLDSNGKAATCLALLSNRAAGA